MPLYYFVTGVLALLKTDEEFTVKKGRIMENFLKACLMVMVIFLTRFGSRKFF